MNGISLKIRKLRDQQLTRGLRAAAIMGFLVLGCSSIRGVLVGWHAIMYVHILTYMIVFGAALLERRLSFAIRAGIIVGACFILGTASLVVWGFGSFSLPALFCGCILATIFFGYRGGLLACVAGAGVVGMVGACVYAGILSYAYDAAAHLNSPVTWLVVLLETASLAGILVVVLGTLSRQMEDLAHALEKQNSELAERNRALQHEISERIRAEEERRKLTKRLQAAEKMEVVGALAGGVAHDLNNILGGIVGYPDMLLDDLPEQSPLRGTVETIKKSGIKAAAIVHDMLALARRKIEVAEPINLNAVIKEYCASPELEMLQRYHPEVAIEVRMDPALMNIHGSAFHLHKVLMNLVSNATEAMPDGGRVLITTENRDVSSCEDRDAALAPGSYAVLSVEDSGIGIPEEDLEKIFEPFYSKKKLGRSGTGLGMAVVWGSVKDHGGHIEVRSIEGGGTTFSLYFPSTSEPSLPAPAPIPRTDIRGAGESILVVDDVPEQREIASRILQELGYSVRVFRSGEEAIDYLKIATADLLILDMLMEPGMNGLDTYRKAAELHPEQKAIITTGYADTRLIREALESGVGRFIRKPYLMDDIGLAVKAELAKQSRGARASSSAQWN